jgi:hypothetical protein
MIPFHKMALLTMAATAPAFVMVFMYTEPDVGWHHAVKRPYPPIYDVDEPIILGQEQCAAFRRSTSDFRRAAPAGLPSSGAVYLWKLLRLNCLMPHECFERERGFDDDDDRITRLSNAENELQRKNCAPFLTQPPWGRHAFHGSPRILEKHRRVNRTEVLPVAVAKDPFTWYCCGVLVLRHVPSPRVDGRRHRRDASCYAGSAQPAGGPRACASSGARRARRRRGPSDLRSGPGSRSGTSGARGTRLIWGRGP